jgi:hypothetical protein
VGGSERLSFAVELVSIEEERAWIDEDLLCEVQERWRSDWGIGSRDEAGVVSRVFRTFDLR